MQHSNVLNAFSCDKPRSKKSNSTPTVVLKSFADDCLALVELQNSLKVEASRLLGYEKPPPLEQEPDHLTFGQNLYSEYQRKHKNAFTRGENIAVIMSQGRKLYVASNYDNAITFIKQQFGCVKYFLTEYDYEFMDPNQDLDDDDDDVDDIELIRI